MARVLNGSAIGRGGAWAAFAALTLAYLVLMPAPGLRAQEPKDGAKAEPAAEAKEAPAAAPAADAAAPAAPAEASKKSQANLLRWAIDASGPIGLFLLCLSIYFVAAGHPPVHGAAGQRGRARRRWSRSSRPRSRRRSSRRRTTPAATTSRSSPAWSGPGVANLPNGRPEAKEAMNAMTEEIVTGMEPRISYLAIIGTARPDDRAGRHDLRA